MDKFVSILRKTFSADTKSEFKRLFKYVRPYRGYLIIAIIAIIVGSLLGLAGPYTLQFLIDAVFVENDRNLLSRIAGLLMIIFASQSVFYFIRGYLLAFIGEKVMADVRKDLFEHLQKLSLNFFNETRTGELVSRLTNDVTTIRSVVTSDISTALSQVLTFFGALVLIIITDWRLTAFMFALVPVIVLLAVILGRYLRIISKEVQDQLAEATTIAEESMSGIRVVKSFNQENFEVSRYSQKIDKAVELAMKRIRLSSVFGPTVSFLGFGAVVSIFWFGGVEVIEGRLTAGQLFMFLILTMTIASSIGSFSSLWSHVQSALGATQRIFELLDTHSEIQDKENAKILRDVRGEILFDRVSFHYVNHPEKSVLNNVSLQIDAGEVIALVGPSGAGKTTLVNLIARFYDPPAGRIEVDGQDIRDLKVESLRKQIGIVPQETLLFGGTVKENILYGRLDASEDEIISAARAANAHQFIKELSNGYETIVGERGVKLSGGQRQRIAIARAILKDPRILLLDEATSSLDSESEGYVQEALDRLMKNRTSIIIAHRLSTIKNAGRIAVLNNGELVEIGSHEELLEVEGLYARLHRIQFETSLQETVPI